MYELTTILELGVGFDSREHRAQPFPHIAKHFQIFVQPLHSWPGPGERCIELGAAIECIRALAGFDLDELGSDSEALGFRKDARSHGRSLSLDAEELTWSRCCTGVYYSTSRPE